MSETTTKKIPSIKEQKIILKGKSLGNLIVDNHICPQCGKGILLLSRKTGTYERFTCYICKESSDLRDGKFTPTPKDPKPEIYKIFELEK